MILPGALLESIQRAHRGRYFYPALLSTMWVAMVVAVNPIGDFPLNDDWAYGLAVKDLIERHQIRYPGWIAGSFVAHLLLGYVFCLPSGFSFTALRLGAAMLGLVAVLATYTLARQAGAARRISFICGASLAVNPLVFQGANTFMTDVPFLAFMLAGIVSTIRAFRRDSLIAAGLATTCIVIATLIRQLGIFVPVAVAGSMLLMRKPTSRQFAVVLLGSALVFGALHLYESWLRRSGQMPGHYGQQGREIVDLIAHPETFQSTFGGWVGVRNRADTALVYLGLFSTPALLVILSGWRKTSNAALAVAWVSAVAFAVDAGESLLGRSWLMPFVDGYNLFNLGVGPMTLVDTFLRPSEAIPHAGPWLPWTATIAGILSGALSVFLFMLSGARLLERMRVPRSVADPGLGIGLLLSLGLSLVLVFQFSYDRYLIPSFPILILGLVAGTRTGTTTDHDGPFVIATAALGLIGFFSVAATHDYLAWNRARWLALNELTTVEQISPERIDGGFEFNAKYQDETKFQFETRPNPGKSWWWVDDDEYRITFGEMPGYDMQKSYPFERWLNSGVGTILVLKRQPW